MALFDNRGWLLPAILIVLLAWKSLDELNLIPSKSSSLPSLSSIQLPALPNFSSFDDLKSYLLTPPKFNPVNLPPNHMTIQFCQSCESNQHFNNSTSSQRRLSVILIRHPLYQSFLKPNEPWKSFTPHLTRPHMFSLHRTLKWFVPASGAVDSLARCGTWITWRLHQWFHSW